MIFRLFCAAVAFILFIFAAFPPSFYTVYLRARVWLGMGSAYAVVAAYLMIPGIRAWTGRYFLQPPIIATIIIPIFSLSWQPPFYLDDLVSLSMTTSYSLSILLLFPLIITAWQYNFRMVIILFGVLGAMDPLIYLISLGPQDSRVIAYLYFSLIRIVAFVAIGFIITELMKNQRKRQSQLIEMNNRLKLQADVALELSAARERNKLSHELHDVLAHTLSSLAVQLEAVKASWETGGDKVEALLDKALENTRRGLKETRTVVKNLRSEPLVDVGFNDAVRLLTRDAERRGDFTVQLDLEESIDDWEYETIHGIYRIIQEALQNTIKHAEADLVEISLTEPEAGMTEIRISDDGKGFTTPKLADEYHFGINIMKERARSIGAEFSITSTVDSGTEVTLSFRRSQ